MDVTIPSAAVTGATGYLGSRICEALDATGWQVIKLTRSPDKNLGTDISYDLSAPLTVQLTKTLRSVDVLVHAAYDLSLSDAADVWRVNVEGTRKILEAAVTANVSRVIVLSSMSAYEGTTQLYGRAKLEIEAMTIASGGCALRPGLVYGSRPGGMAGALKKFSYMPVAPVIAGGLGIYTVSEDDLMKVISMLARAATVPSATISVAHPRKVQLSELLRTFARSEGRTCHLVPIPWKTVYWTLRTFECLHLHLPFRSDSLLGLVYPAPSLTGVEHLSALGVAVRPFAQDDINLADLPGVT